MVKSFLELVADHIHEHYKNTVEKLCIVLPNRRGSIFLKQHLAKSFGQTIWLPRIISAEELITEFSGLQTLEEIDLICHLFESYRMHFKEKAENFESFAKWGTLILQDFNEIDRYLVDSKQLYENLREIKVIENWSLGADTLTEHQLRYIEFMGNLGAIHRHFTQFLLEHNWAYQGLAYRRAVENCISNKVNISYEKFLFCGFNALNTSEIKIIEQLHKEKKAEVLWDADRYYLDNRDQEAGYFLRNNLLLFPDRDKKFIDEHFRTKKQIEIVAAPKQMGQAQVVRQTINNLAKQGVRMDQVAVVLANEKLLLPVLNQLPDTVPSVNITMEYPVRFSGAFDLLELLLQIQLSFNKQNRKSKTIYYKDFISLLRQPLLHKYLHLAAPAIRPDKIIDTVTQKNISFIQQSHLKDLFEDSAGLLIGLFQPAKEVATWCGEVIKVMEQLIQEESRFKQQQENIESENLQLLIRQLNRVTEMIGHYPYFNEFGAFKQLFSQVLGNVTIPFIGEPLSGLQIMGVLETRVLDFEYVILVNVNEGILPSGKTSNSFIPNDLKKAFGLPLYLEKDAVYAYHFYRLLQRARQITITFDSETDTFGKGERSRFITQLQLELQNYNPETVIQERVAEYAEFKDSVLTKPKVTKTPEVLAEILSKATSNEKFGGLSPSSLISFKDCSLRFYFRYGLHLKEPESIQENAESNTFGSILHLALELLYNEIKGAAVTMETLKTIQANIDDAVGKSFSRFFEGSEPMGKNVLQLEVIKVYIKKLINQDKSLLSKNQNNSLTILDLETEFSSSLRIEVNNKPELVYIKGKIDRIDRYGLDLRIIDYKSSVKETDKFVFDGFEKLFQDINYNKQLQLFVYAWLLHKNKYAATPTLRPCIIAFKVFSDEPRYIIGADKKPLQFTETLLDEFEVELTKYIRSIIDDSQTFAPTEDEANCLYCSYKTICNIQD